MKDDAHVARIKDVLKAIKEYIELPGQEDNLAALKSDLGVIRHFLDVAEQPATETGTISASRGETGAGKNGQSAK